MRRLSIVDPDVTNQVIPEQERPVTPVLIGPQPFPRTPEGQGTQAINRAPRDRRRSSASSVASVPVLVPPESWVFATPDRLLPRVPTTNTPLRAPRDPARRALFRGYRPSIFRVFVLGPYSNEPGTSPKKRGRDDQDPPNPPSLKRQRRVL